MGRVKKASALYTILLLCVLTCPGMVVSGQSGTKSGEWRSYGGDLGNTRYSPLDQIQAGNFNKLEIAWRFKTDNLGPRPEYNLETTPLMIGGVLYSTAGSRRAVVALNAVTGEMKWVYSLDEGQRAQEAPRVLSGRGLAYWTDGKEERIVYVTPGYQLVALDAKTGRPIQGFGNGGIVDLKTGDDQVIDPVTGEVGLHAAPIVARNVVIVGAAHKSGRVPKSKANVKGYVRGYDVRTGKRLWIFHTIPRPGEFGNDTWLKDSWSYTGNTGVWGQISVDETLGLAYLPVEEPTGDYYGANRPGDNLFSDSLVAIELETGKRRWHVQLIHHDLEDYDPPCAPILADISVGGRLIKAVAQPTKQAFLYVFDRATGQPVWPLEERPVPKGDVPGEWYSPTQPFPTKPPPFDRQGVTRDDLIDFTPELRADALKLVEHHKMGPLFTPPVVSQAEGILGTLTAPTGLGGANWPGGSFDPETQMLYVFSNSSVASIGLIPPRPGQSEMEYIQGTALSTPQTGVNPGASSRQTPRTTSPTANGRAAASDGEGGGAALTVAGLPLLKPPYARISAIDLKRGEIAWQIAHGETPDNIRNHPALKNLNIPRTGRPGNVGTLVTKTLLIAGESGYFTTPSGSRGAMLRAYNKESGKEVGAVYMPAPQSGSPMTYMVDGRQYLVVAISGSSYPGEILAFRLPG
jgi:quinoprotein glucose dehydrogenase